MEIRFPNISPEAKATEQLVQMRSYLYQLVQDLNLSLRQLEAPERSRPLFRRRKKLPGSRRSAASRRRRG